MYARNVIRSAAECVALWRPVAQRYPASMAWALALHAACLHHRGRTDEADSAAGECLEWCARARDLAAAEDLRYASKLLAAAGRTDEALTLVSGLVERLRAAERPELGNTLLEYGLQLERLHRWDEAVDVLREASGHKGQNIDVRPYARMLLLIALYQAGRYAEMAPPSSEDLGYLALMSRLAPSEFDRYESLLAVLAEAQEAAGWDVDTRERLAARQRSARRRLTRRQRLARVVLALLGRSPAERQAKRQAKQRARQQAAVAAEVSAVERCRLAGDEHALAAALAALAQARWLLGGQRSPALTAQRESVELTRRLAQQDPAGTRRLLAERLRRFAEWAEAIGLHTDAEAARAEAAGLTARREGPRKS